MYTKTDNSAAAPTKSTVQVGEWNRSDTSENLAGISLSNDQANIVRVAGRILASSCQTPFMKYPTTMMVMMIGLSVIRVDMKFRYGTLSAWTCG